MVRFAFLFIMFLAQLPVFSQVKLADTLAILAQKEPTALKASYAREQDSLMERGIIFNARNVKAKLIDFTLTNEQGKRVNLAEKVQGGPVILFWFQGAWNPYCLAQLRFYQRYVSEFKKYGAYLLALTPEPDNQIKSTKNKLKITFDIFSDKDLAIAQQYQLCYTPEDGLLTQLQEAYKIKNQLGDSLSRFALPATYLIAPNGKIVFAHLHANHTSRAEPSDLLRVLKGMGFPERK